MNPFRKICLLFVMVLTMASACEEKVEETLQKDMVEFDRAFVPVLFHVLNDDLESAKQATHFLDYTWKKFDLKYHSFNIENDDHEEDMRMINAWMEDAFTAIDHFHQQGAYIYLDHVRYQLMEMRRRQNINYYLDYFWEFEAALDLALEPATDQMICLLDYCEFEDLVSELNYTWHQLQLAHFDAALYEFDKDELFYLKFRKKNIKDAIREFNEAVKEGEGEKIAVTASILEESYLDLLHCFGDFTSSQTHFANR